MKHNTNQFVRDAAAYLRVAAMANQKPEITLFTLAHDINGIANEEPCFLPRVSGYADWERKNKITMKARAE